MPSRVRPWSIRRIVACAIVACAVGSQSVAWADERAELEKARASFLARNWTDAEARLRVLLDPKSGLRERLLVSQARMYLGASLLAQGRKEEARDVFEKLVLDDPTYEPDPLGFPSAAINTFIDVRSSLLEQIRNAQQTAARLAAEKRAREDAEREAHRIWLEKVKRQAAEEKITVRHSRIVASIPFGAGQFQNDQPVLGWLFLGAEVAAIAGTVVTYGMYRYARSRENEELQRPGGDVNQLVPQYHERAEDLRIANLGFAGAFLGVAAIGIVQAHLAFVPESAETKKRDLPPRPTGPGASERDAAPPSRESRAEGPSVSSRSDRASPSTLRSSLSSIAPIVSPLPGIGGGFGGMLVGARVALF